MTAANWFAGERAVVSGGGGGIGRATAERQIAADGGLTMY
jgi:NAD(P)-dependent dehydrogenase (short-subunit alcohol dehydrogenase family)